MAFTVSHDENNTRQIKAYLDSEADLEALGTDFDAGSEAYIVTDSLPVYMLAPTGGWKKVLSFE